ncbi:MAG: hypothetical protein JSR98_04245 [Proteobacteria bacterium]|nr:hypothetical protein [Pseudomonadota bacterium]
MSGLADPIYLLPLALGIYVALVLRLGFVHLPGLPPVSRTAHPRGYWALVVLPPLVVAGLITLDLALR